jgi:hypothetical protein
MEKKKNGLLYLSIDAVYQISLKSEMMGWTIVFWLDDLVWNVSPQTGSGRHYTFISPINMINKCLKQLKVLSFYVTVHILKIARFTTVGSKNQVRDQFSTRQNQLLPSSHLPS